MYIFLYIKRNPFQKIVHVLRCLIRRSKDEWRYTFMFMSFAKYERNCDECALFPSTKIYDRSANHRWYLQTIAWQNVSRRPFQIVRQSWSSGKFGFGSIQSFTTGRVDRDQHNKECYRTTRGNCIFGLI